MAAAPSRLSRAIHAPSRSPSSCSPRTHPRSMSPKPSRQAARLTKPSPSSCAACSSASPNSSAPCRRREKSGWQAEAPAPQRPLRTKVGQTLSSVNPANRAESILGQVFEIHVAAGQDHAHGADVFRQLAEQDGGGGDGAARLHQDLQAQENELDGGAK